MTEIVEEGDAELLACLHETEEGITGIASGLGSGFAGDFSLCHVAADVVFGSVCVQWDFRTVEHV